MRLVVLGLSLSSSWGNGHATTFRALLKAYAARGHDILFLERDVPWYRDNRDVTDPDYCQLAYYSDLAGLGRWRNEIAYADAVRGLGVTAPVRWIESDSHSFAAPGDADVLFGAIKEALSTTSPRS